MNLCSLHQNCRFVFHFYIMQINPIITRSFQIFYFGLLFLISSCSSSKKASTGNTAHSGNPLFQGWYADPEATIFGNEYWIYPTYSAPYNEQVFLDAFSSGDLLAWKKHPHIIDTAAVKWARRAMWAPAIVKKENKYYLFFSANDIQNEQQTGGIGVAVANKPEGPFKDLLGKPLLDKIYNRAQPIDQFIFHDNDGRYYMIYGGWGRCNIARLKADFSGLESFEDGNTVKEITPKGYVEGPFMFKRNNKYYFMWSEGGWGGPNYRVAYAISNSVFGPFERIGTVLQQDSAVATGAGHHSVIHVEKNDKWYIVYHRRPLGETDRNHRVTCIDEMRFDEKGFIEPVKITSTGVTANRLK
jgi:beta-xylosidase